MDPSMILRQILPFETAYFYITTRTNTTPAQFTALQAIYRDAIQQRDAFIPKVLAALRLITKSNFVGACTGRSPGFSPLRMRLT